MSMACDKWLFRICVLSNHSMHTCTLSDRTSFLIYMAVRRCFTIHWLFKLKIVWICIWIDLLMYWLFCSCIFNAIDMSSKQMRSKFNWNVCVCGERTLRADKPTHTHTHNQWIFHSKWLNWCCKKLREFL